MSELGQNLGAASGQSFVDSLNADFYGKIQYPWPPMTFERVLQHGFWTRLLHQDLGYWGAPRLRAERRIWVAGCGTNQAVITALKFPESQVIGSDLSDESLQVAATNARTLGIRNLDLRRESINDVAYTEEFDQVICSGVIHHNADPKLPLQRLRAALKSDGILELMVYNQFHRIIPAAFQEAVRTLLGCASSPDYERELPFARKLAQHFRRGNEMSKFLAEQEGAPPAAFADFLIQPVEHSYTVKSLAALVTACGLQLLLPCVDQFSREAGALDWNLDFDDSELCEQYYALPDIERWHVSNLLLQEASPMLWFYLQRKDSSCARQTEQEVCEGFLNARFVRTACEREVFVRRNDGQYTLSKRRPSFPQQRPAEGPALRLYEALDESRELRHTVMRLGLDLSPASVMRLRVALATTACPHLSVCPPGDA